MVRLRRTMDAVAELRIRALVDFSPIGDGTGSSQIVALPQSESHFQQRLRFLVALDSFGYRLDAQVVHHPRQALQHLLTLDAGGVDVTNVVDPLQAANDVATALAGGDGGASFAAASAADIANASFHASTSVASSNVAVTAVAANPGAVGGAQ